MSLFAVAFVLLYTSMLVLSFVKRPFFGLVAYLMAFYLNPPMRWWGESLPDLRWSFTAAVVTILSILIRDRELFFKGWFLETKVFGLFTVYVLLQLIWAIDLSTHGEWVSTCINFFILMVMLQGAIKDERDVVGFILVNLIGCSYFGYLGAIRSVGGRLDGIGGPAIASSNQMSQHLIAMLFAGGYLLFLKGRRWWWYLGVALLLAILVKTILMAGSRGSFLAVGLTGCLALLVVPGPVRKRMYLMAGAAAVVLAVEVGPMIQERFAGVFADKVEEIEDDSARSRIFIVEAQIRMFQESPMLGHGHKGTQILSPLYIPPEYRSMTETGESIRASHNFLLSLLVDHGIVGTLIYLFITVRCMSRLLDATRADMPNEQAYNMKLLLMGLTLGLICHIISGMTSDHKNGETDIWFYVLIPLCLLKLREALHAR